MNKEEKTGPAGEQARLAEIREHQEFRRASTRSDRITVEDIDYLLSLVAAAPPHDWARLVAGKLAATIRKKGFKSPLYEAMENLMNETDENDAELDEFVSLVSPIISRHLEGEQGAVEDGSSLLKIIRYGLEGDKQKVRDYATFMADKISDEQLAAAIRSYASGEYGTIVRPLESITDSAAAPAATEQCPVTCAAFTMHLCKEAHRCVLDAGHSFDPMYGQIHHFETHLAPIEPRVRIGVAEKENNVDK